MTSPSLICLSSKDPLLTAIELYSELKRLEIIEAEFRSQYNVRMHVSVRLLKVKCSVSDLQPLYATR